MPAYRFELSRSGRAVCKDKECKAEGVKIQKGELRFGSMYTVNEVDMWSYKHWNCVTPTQWKNIKAYLEENGGDIDFLDGYDELDVDDQTLLRQCLEDGKVPDDEWRHDPELNVIGGTRKRTPKRKKKDVEEGEGNDDGAAVNGDLETPSKPQKGARKRKTEAAANGENPGAPEANSKKKRVNKKRKAESDDENEAASSVPPKKSRGRKVKDEPEEQDGYESPALTKGGRAKKVKDEPVEGAGLQSSIPAKKGRAKKARVKPEGEDSIQPPIPSKKSKAKKVKDEPEEQLGLQSDIPAKISNDEEVQPEEVDEELQKIPAKASRAKKVKQENTDGLAKPSERRGRSARGKNTLDEAEDEADAPAPVPKPKGRKSKTQALDDHEPVEATTTAGGKRGRGRKAND